MTDNYTNPDVLPIVEAGYRHSIPAPRFGLPIKGETYITSSGKVRRCTQDRKAEFGRRWIIEPEPAIGGSADAKAHKYAKERGMYLVGFQNSKVGDSYIGFSYKGSVNPWGGEPTVDVTETMGLPVYILAPLGQPVIEPVEGETATKTQPFPQPLGSGIGRWGNQP